MPVKTSPCVKGCRTPAVTMRLRRTGLAGVRQASGEETAGSLRSLFRPVQPMGILRLGDGFGGVNQH